MRSEGSSHISDQKNHLSGFSIRLSSIQAARVQGRNTRGKITRCLLGIVSSMAEEQEAEDEIGAGVGEEHESRGGHGVRRLAADHQVVEGVHRPEGRKGARYGLHPVRLEIDRPPAAARGRHREDGDRPKRQHGLAALREPRDHKAKGSAAATMPTVGSASAQGSGPSETPKKSRPTANRSAICTMPTTKRAVSLAPSETALSGVGVALEPGERAPSPARRGVPARCRAACRGGER